MERDTQNYMKISMPECISTAARTHNQLDIFENLNQYYMKYGRKELWDFDIFNNKIDRSIINKMIYVSLFFTVFLLLNLMDFAMTIYGLRLGLVNEYNDFFYISNFPIMKLAFIPIIETIMLWSILHRNSRLAYFSSIGINSAYTMIVINNFVAIMLGMRI